MAGKKKQERYWNDPKNIDQAFDSLVETLRRIPKYDEMPGGVMHAMSRGKYCSDVKTFNDYLKYWGFELNQREWPREAVNVAFYGMINRLRRVSTREEFIVENGGALTAIMKGICNPKIKSWRQFVKYHGLEPGKKEWPREAVNDALYSQINELRRIPTQNEFKNKNGGALTAIKDGRYHTETKTWNQFLEYHGFEPAHKIRNMESLVQRIVED